MIKSIKITNHLQESIVLDLYEPEKSGFIIRSIEGLGPVKANIFFTDIVTLDGAIDNGGRLTTRNIVMSLIFQSSETETIEDIRLKSYRYWPIKRNIIFEIETDNRHCYTIGRVESNVPAIFEQHEGCQISILCPNSYYQDMNLDVTNFYAMAFGFEFPFENDSIIKSGKNLLVNGLLSWTANDVNFKMQSDYTFYAHGTANKLLNMCISHVRFTAVGSYYLSGFPKIANGLSSLIISNNGNIKNPVASAIDTGDGVAFTVDYRWLNKDIYIYIRVPKDALIDALVAPSVRQVMYIDGKYVPYGENLIETYDIIWSTDTFTYKLDSDGKITIDGTLDDDMDIILSRISNIPNGEEYILSGCPVNDDLFKMAIRNMADVEKAIDNGNGVTFIKTSNQDYDLLHLTVKGGVEIPETVIQPMIRLSSIEDSTYEAHIPTVDDGPMIEFGDINNTSEGNLFYTGDAETGMIINIFADGPASGISILRTDINESLSISDARFTEYVGAIRAGDQIIINTNKGEKSARLLRDGQYYNIINTLEAPMVWFELKVGDNVFMLNADEGLSNLQYKISYRKIYSGV